jgi:hypothetical protein
MFGKIATQTGVSIGDFVAMSPAIIVWGRIKTALATLLKSFLINQGLEFPQLI